MIPLTRKLILCMLACGLIALESPAQANSEDPCKLMLQHGLYKTFTINRTASFDRDIKSYFESEIFRTDFTDRRWSGGVSAVIDAVPVTLNAHATKEEVNEFQKKVKSAHSFSLSESFYEYAVLSVPDLELAREYRICVGERKFGFRLFPLVTETEATFIVNYQKEFEPDPMPKVTQFYAINALYTSGAPGKGETLKNNTTIVCKRDRNKDLTFILETDKGVVTYRVPSEPSGFNRDLPVGTIIASYLNFEQFNAVTQNNSNSPTGTWNSRFSKWSPADGRPVPYSKFTAVTSRTEVPDLRGVFLRALNQFDPNQPSLPNHDRIDPDQRTVGSFQSDATRLPLLTVSEAGGHSHGGYVGGGQGRHQTGQHEGPAYGASPMGEAGKHSHAISGGDKETRPKNVSIYYYIRIN